MSDSPDSFELQVELALAEYLRKTDDGTSPDREAFLDQHPELREQLAELLTAADWIEELAGPTLADVARLSQLPLSEIADQLDETLVHGLDASHVEQRTLPMRDCPPTTPQRGLELSQPNLPCRFGDYVLERVLGRGGMGVVYYGHQVNLERPVAIKMIRSGALASEEEVLRFYSEARSAARLDHPNIVTVHQCGEVDGHRFFSMDYVAGQDLARMIEDELLSGKRAARYVRDVALAIQYAHDRGIVHRDLKPANVLVDEQDNVHITDFGLAKSIEQESDLTVTGAAVGTPSYMSPEQAAGNTDEQPYATDVYSLGAVLFTIVTGRPPFKSSSVVQTIMQVIHRPAPMARSLNPALDEDIETIIDVCLQKSPERRYASAGQLASDLDRYLHGSPIQARPLAPWRRAWYWLLGVPIFGAILDNRVVEPTDAHRWVQRGLISVGLLIVLAWLLMLIPSSLWFTNRMPRTVRVAAGATGGGYDQLATTICQLLSTNDGCEAIAVSSEGSTDNIQLLQRDEVDLALLQADAVDSATIAVVAPLYYEVVHVMVRRDVDITSLADLKNHRVRVGSEKSGSHRIAGILFRHIGLLPEELQLEAKPFGQAAGEPLPDAAIIVTKLGSSAVHDALHSGLYRLLPMPNAWQFALDEPSFHAHFVQSQHYPDCGLPEEGVAAVATTAFLAAKYDTPSVLITAVLRNLFQPEVVAACDILTADQVAHWPELAWHPASREFFSSYRGSSPNQIGR